MALDEILAPAQEHIAATAHHIFPMLVAVCIVAIIAMAFEPLGRS